MRYIVPSYYPHFSCIAGECKHSCCIGWEIDIDEETESFYHSVGGAFGERLMQNIEHSRDATSHFRLNAEERCPFLNDRGLCDIILTLGETQLCQICTDHPRFRNFFSDRIEIGLGLCCEAAGNLILFGTDDFTMIQLSEDNEISAPLSEEEEALLQKREEIFSLILNRKLNLRTRVERLLVNFGLSLPNRSIAEWASFYRKLECLEPKRDEILTLLESASPMDLTIPPDSKFKVAFERLLCYFIFRHFAGALDDGQAEARVSFAILSTLMIYSAMAVLARQKGKLTEADLIELARLYSAEIEYSEENLEAILSELSKKSAKS